MTSDRFSIGDDALPGLRIGRVVDGKVVVERMLATPLVSAQDGPRMSGKLSNFGGKKAAPFRKGGKRRAKIVVAKAAARKIKKARAKGADLSKLSKPERDALPSSAFVFPGSRRYPIHDKAHAHAALIDSQGKPEHAAVVAAVRARYGWMK